MEEKLSDTSFTLNFKEIIGSMDDKSELEQMKAKLQEKDEYIKVLLRKLEEQEGKEGKSGGKNKSNSSFVTTQHDTHQIGGLSKNMG